ncbi:hypothetical protein JW905_05690 [bacterium]|nr:hypothetical protein [candidate division CSSED10-310 bacterium]
MKAVSVQSSLQWLTVALAALIAIQAVVLIHALLKPANPTHAFLPMLSPTSAGPSSWQLEAPAILSDHINSQLASLGRPVTMDDLAQGLLALINNPEAPKLSMRQRRHLAVLCKEAWQLKAQLLVNQENILRLENQMLDDANAALQVLDRDQVDGLLATRDTSAVMAVEQGYWQDLITALETDDD